MDKKIRKLEKKLNREQKKLSRQYEQYKKTKNNIKTNLKNDSKEYIGKNINKQILVIQKIHRKLANARENYLYYVANELVKRRPTFITIEDLNIKGMLKNKHLSKAISNMLFGKFIIILKHLCIKYGIQLRQVDRFYPSSKKCSKCDEIKKNLKLKDRIYICSCGNIMDRDYNAACTLEKAAEYICLT